MTKHSHYKKDVSGLSMIDVYRVLKLFNVTDPCEQHAIKKLLCVGLRGAKSAETDIQEAIDTLERWKQMRAEDATRMPDSFGQKNMIEPAAEIDDDSERQLLIQQSGEMAEHVYPAIDQDRPIVKWALDQI